LKESLAAVPNRYGIMHAFWRTFVPRPDDDRSFAERMTVRLTQQQAPINDPSSFYRPVTKIVHRGDPNVTVGRGNHGLIDSNLRTLATWYPIEILHFPLRSRAQWMRKIELQGEAFTKHIARAGTGYHLTAYSALQAGRIDEQYESLIIDEVAVERGLAEHTLTVDERLRDVLRALRPRSDGGFALPSQLKRAASFPAPTLADDVAYAAEAAALSEADTVRVQRRIDDLERRLAALEARA
jgi:hypothetical protein